MSEAVAPLSRRLVAEALGTAILVATVVGSGIMAERLAGGNQAIALLGNTIPTGAILVVIISVFGPISGAHFNPAVTLVFATRGTTPWNEVAPYVIVQCVGGIAGTILAHLMFDLAPLMIGTKVRSGPSQWLGEAVATFTLVLTILGGLRYTPQAIPWLVGLSDHRCLLVHLLDVLRQSSSDNCARVYDDLLRDRHQPRPRLYSRSVDRSSHGRSSVAIAFSCSSQVICRSDGAR